MSKRAKPRIVVINGKRQCDSCKLGTGRRPFPGPCIHEFEQIMKEWGRTRSPRR